MKCKLTIYSLLLVIGMYASAESKPSATLIITHAAIYTVDKERPNAEAVAVIGDRIVAVARVRELIFGAVRKRG